MNIEKFFKEKLSKHEYEYSEEAWNKMEKLLDKKSASLKPMLPFGGSAALKYLAIGLSSVAIIGVSIWAFNNGDTDYTPIAKEENQEELSEKSIIATDNTAIEYHKIKIDNVLENQININKTIPISISRYNSNKQWRFTTNIDDLLNYDNLIVEEESLVEEEELPILVRFDSENESYYFIPNPRIKVYDLPEPNSNNKLEGQHIKDVEKKPMQKPNKKVFDKKKRKTLREFLGF